MSNGGIYCIDLSSMVDLTLPLYSDMPASFREKPLRIESRCTHARDGFAASTIIIGSHTGTHVDAPYHFLPQGPGVDGIPLPSLVLPGYVLDLRGTPKAISREILVGGLQRLHAISTHSAVVLWTGWDKYLGDACMNQHPYLTDEAAFFLAEAQVGLVAIDATGVDDSLASEFPAHHILLSSSIPIVENLCSLDRLGEGEFLFAFLPLPVRNGDAAPVRAVAWRFVDAGRDILDC